MIRIKSAGYGRKRCSSHRRGNDSQWKAEEFFIQLFIPQAWEGFVNSAAAEALAAVRPTGVGMIRVSEAGLMITRSSSHRRGNDSIYSFVQFFDLWFIPQAWE